MLVIGLTGDVGAGKSTVSSAWGSQGARVISADPIVAELWKREDLVTLAVERWGRSVLTAAGTLDHGAVLSLIHICLRFLIRNYRDLERITGRRAATVFDRADTRSLVKGIMKELDIDPRQYEPGWVVERLCRAKSEGDPRTLDIGELDFPIGPIYSKYQEGLARQGAVDFEDLLVLPLHLLVNDSNVRERERERIDWILVDEYQDVNRPQYLLLKALSSGRERIMVVGDPDQSIYGWRGADMNMILNFEKDFPDARVFVLEQNYRSTPNILGGANGVIRNNFRRKPKKLWTSRSGGEKIHVLLAGNERVEANFITEEVLRLRGDVYKRQIMEGSSLEILEVDVYKRQPLASVPLQ